jgi:hypothetical protein
MRDFHPAILNRLCNMDQEEALAEERIATLMRLLTEENEYMQNLLDKRHRLEMILNRLLDANTIYDSQDEEIHYD